MTTGMTNVSKRSWGKSKLKYCPERKKVWQLKYDPNGYENTLIIYNDMPSYGLEREIAPKDLKERGA